MTGTVEAITARMLELADDFAFEIALKGDNPKTVEYVTLRSQLKEAKEAEQA